MFQKAYLKLNQSILLQEIFGRSWKMTA